MDCPHCGIAFHDKWSQVEIGLDGKERAWRAEFTKCPACGEMTIDLTQVEEVLGATYKKQEFTAYPKHTLRKPIAPEVPPDIAGDYKEACATLSVSEKASAALSRRCLQAILRQQGYKQKDLAQQIDALLNEGVPAKVIPTGLRDTVDAIRNFGNFSAHPINDQTTLQIIDVESEEAEWCLEILEEMFDHYYVKPAQAAARKVALNAKLAAAGKPSAK